MAVFNKDFLIPEWIEVYGKLEEIWKSCLGMPVTDSLKRNLKSQLEELLTYCVIKNYVHPESTTEVNISNEGTKLIIKYPYWFVRLVK